MYTRICGQQQLGKCLCVAGSQPTRKNFRCKIYSCKIFSYVFLVRKYFHNKIKANYGISRKLASLLHELCLPCTICRWKWWFSLWSSLASWTLSLPCLLCNLVWSVGTCCSVERDKKTKKLVQMLQMRWLYNHPQKLSFTDMIIYSSTPGIHEANSVSAIPYYL